MYIQNKFWDLPSSTTITKQIAKHIPTNSPILADHRLWFSAPNNPFISLVRLSETDLRSYQNTSLPYPHLYLLIPTYFYSGISQPNLYSKSQQLKELTRKKGTLKATIKTPYHDTLTIWELRDPL